MKATYRGGLKARLLLIFWFLFMAIWSIFTPKIGASVVESWVSAKNEKSKAKHNNAAS